MRVNRLLLTLPLALVLFVGVIAAVLSAGLLMWKAEATPLAGSVEPFTVNKSVSPVLKAGCMFERRAAALIYRSRTISDKNHVRRSVWSIQTSIMLAVATSLCFSHTS